MSFRLSHHTLQSLFVSEVKNSGPFLKREVTLREKAEKILARINEDIGKPQKKSMKRHRSFRHYFAKRDQFYMRILKALVDKSHLFKTRLAPYQ